MGELKYALLEGTDSLCQPLQHSLLGRLSPLLAKLHRVCLSFWMTNYVQRKAEQRKSVACGLSVAGSWRLSVRTMTPRTLVFGEGVLAVSISLC
jgi:hypothetical protein